MENLKKMMIEKDIEQFYDSTITKEVFDKLKPGQYIQVRADRYGDGYEIMICENRLETDEEFATRVRQITRRQEIAAENERLMYLKLKAKFEK